ncbi:hypothetical protein E2C01_056429 [Portunus trituberculatus]|uniref:Uncharacterized protein n=1 Tax=Portunus trituberculatus TaxID=210409 RepID=A0A5B7GY56_PORTR|nr:hypothetical protein [Portunus trituberculatus]
MEIHGCYFLSSSPRLPPHGQGTGAGGEASGRRGLEEEVETVNRGRPLACPALSYASVFRRWSPLREVAGRAACPALSSVGSPAGHWPLLGLTCWPRDMARHLTLPARFSVTSSSAPRPQATSMQRQRWDQPGRDRDPRHPPAGTRPPHTHTAPLPRCVNNGPRETRGLGDGGMHASMGDGAGELRRGGEGERRREELHATWSPTHRAPMVQWASGYVGRREQGSRGAGEQGPSVQQAAATRPSPQHK